jgi:hypothetical protein
VLAVPVLVLPLPVPAESDAELMSPVPLLPPVVVPEASVAVPSLLPPHEVRRVALRARAARASWGFRVRIRCTKKGKNVLLIRGLPRQYQRDYCGFSSEST